MESSPPVEIRAFSPYPMETLPPAFTNPLLIIPLIPRRITIVLRALSSAFSTIPSTIISSASIINPLYTLPVI